MDSCIKCGYFLYFTFMRSFNLIINQYMVYNKIQWPREARLPAFRRVLLKFSTFSQPTSWLVGDIRRAHTLSGMSNLALRVYDKKYLKPALRAGCRALHDYINHNNSAHRADRGATRPHDKDKQF